MHAFTVTEVQEELRKNSQQYREFLRVPSLSVGLYELAVGIDDTQRPHTEDEIYYVISGHGTIRVDEEDQPVSAGSVVYVAANVRHYFHTISQDLSLLVFFAPAEYARRNQP